MTGMKRKTPGAGAPKPKVDLATLKLETPKMQDASSASLALYGPAKSGKTETVVALVEEGFEVHYLDFDQNVLSILKIKDEPNFKYYPISDGEGGGIYDYMRTLRTEHRAVACTKHGMLQCAGCAEYGEGFTALDLKKLPENAVVVFDSFTAVQESIVAKARTINNITPLKQDSIEVSFWMAVAGESEPIWNFINKLPSVAKSLVITHQVDRQNLMNSDKVSKFVHPLAGSGTYSLGDKPKRSCTAIWKTEISTIEAKRTPRTAAGLNYYANSPNADKYSKLLLGPAVVQFFKDA